MEALGIVPDIIPIGPSAVLNVQYPSGVRVDMGAELTPTQVKDKPQVTWHAQPDKLYTLVMTDPDAPSRAEPSIGEVRHWLVVNIPGSRLADGDEVTEYIGSGAPQGTGLHRYIFLLYQQPGRLEPDPVLRVTRFQRGSRMKWRVGKFAEQQRLGTPVAGNVFQAQYDDYVPILHQQIARD